MKIMFSYPHFAVHNLYLLNGYEREQSDYGEVVTYKNEDLLEACVRKVLVRIPRRLTGPQLRFLRRGLGMSQEVFGSLIDRDAQTVARIEKTAGEVPQFVDLTIRTRYFDRYDPSVSIGEILSIHNGTQRFPVDKILLTYIDGKWTYCFDIPKIAIEYTQSESVGTMSLIEDAADDGHVYQRRFVMNISETGILSKSFENAKDDRAAFTTLYMKKKYETSN